MSTMVEPALESGFGDHDGQIELSRIADAVKRGEPSPRVTVRKLLEWFSAQRRGFYVVQTIRDELKRLGIETVPDFNEVWIDSEIRFALPTKAEQQDLPQPSLNSGLAASDGVPPTQIVLESALVGGAAVDPTYRIGKLQAANKKVIVIAPNHSLEQAITLMLANDFSQLPVMQSDRDVKGVVSWESIGTRLSLGRPCEEARTFMTVAQIISSDRSLFEAIDIIARHQYVLVQGPDRTITGIVTAADLSRQFHELSEPFLLLGEIEQHVRSLITGKFTPEELRAACDPNDSDREIQSVADLTMGEYIRLLENPGHWGKLALRIDRAAFVEQLRTVRRIRNDVMHFDPDPLSSDELESLRHFARFMESLRELGITC